MSRGRDAAARAAGARAWRRIEPLALYPRPVELRRVRILTAPWLFRLPWFRRFDGYTMWSTILLRHALETAGDDLITHELVHVWQGQHAWVRLWLSYLRPSTFWGERSGYWKNPYEVEARAAVEATRSDESGVGTAGVAAPRPLLDTGERSTGEEQQ